jgi:NifU-like N terminal domain
MLESLQFESEPWTSFYTAGEIIRELRKASGKQNKYGSEGDKAHSDNVIDHDDRPRDVGGLPEDDPAPRECGDEAEFKMFGCGSAIAISSLATEFKGKNSTRKHWPSRTRISSARSAFPRATLLDATRYSRIGGRLHLVGSPIF